MRNFMRVKSMRRVGEFTARSLPRLESVNLTLCGCLDMDLVIKNTLSSFNMHNIYAVYKRMPVHRTSIRRTRAPRFRAVRLNVRLLLVPNLDRQLTTLDRNDRYRPKNKSDSVRIVVRTTLSLIVGYDDFPAVISLSLRVPRSTLEVGKRLVTLQRILPDSRSWSRSLNSVRGKSFHL